MNRDYMFVSSICMECVNGNNFGECQLLPIEEEICLDNEGELFVEKEKEE